MLSLHIYETFSYFLSDRFASQLKRDDLVLHAVQPFSILRRGPDLAKESIPPTKVGGGGGGSYLFLKNTFEGGLINSQRNALPVSKKDKQETARDARCQCRIYKKSDQPKICKDNVQAGLVQPCLFFAFLDI